MDWHAEDTMLALGCHRSGGARTRVRTAMAAQTRGQERYLGGRSITKDSSAWEGNTKASRWPPGRPTTPGSCPVA